MTSLLHTALSAGAPWDTTVMGEEGVSGCRAAGGSCDGRWWWVVGGEGGAAVSSLSPPPPAPPPGHLDIHIKDGPGKATYLSATVRRHRMVLFFFFFSFRSSRQFTPRRHGGDGGSFPREG